MKSFKKALAVFLSVLMVAFSFPLSAFALYNENNDGYAPGEEYYATDYDVEVHAYVTNYDDEYAYGYSAGTVEFFDPTQPLKKSDLSSPDGCFAIIITVENLDDCFSSSLMFDVNWDKVTPANYGRRGLSTGPDSADLIETGKDYGFTFDQTGSSAYGPGPNGHTLYVSTNWLQQDPVNYTQQPYCEEGYDGMVLGVYGLGASPPAKSCLAFSSRFCRIYRCTVVPTCASNLRSKWYLLIKKRSASASSVRASL